jgi:imidazolonepropionase-like amidohydrolase
MTAASTAASPRTVFVGATVVNTHDGSLARDMSVVVEAGTIVHVGSASSVSGEGAEVIDAAGRFLVPGYNDYHAHPLTSSDPEGSLTMMTAMGITGFREMAGDAKLLAARKAGTFSDPNMPAVLQMPGDILTPGNAATPEMAIATVQQQHAEGADFIKVITVSPDAFFAALHEAKRLGLPFLGHLPSNVDVREAIGAGMLSVEHVGPRDAIVLGCSSEEVAIRQTMAANPSKPPPPPPGPPTWEQIRRNVANPTVFTPLDEFARYKRVVATFSESRALELAQRFVAAGAWQVPTLFRNRTMAVGDDPIYRNDPDQRYVPQATWAMWSEVSEQFASFSQDARDAARMLFDLQLRLIKPFKDAGVQMMAGSDLGGGFVIPGIGLHHEFDLLERAGLTPLDVLQMTTIDGARFLGRDQTMGSVEPGKNADLVLLDANPIERVANLHEILGVLRAGRYFPKPVLEAMKDRTAGRLVANGDTIAAVKSQCC